MVVRRSGPCCVDAGAGGLATVAGGVTPLTWVLFLSRFLIAGEEAAAAGVDGFKAAVADCALAGVCPNPPKGFEAAGKATGIFSGFFPNSEVPLTWAAGGCDGVAAGAGFGAGGGAFTGSGSGNTGGISTFFALRALILLRSAASCSSCRILSSSFFRSSIRRSCSCLKRCSWYTLSASSRTRSCSLLAASIRSR